MVVPGEVVVEAEVPAVHKAATAVWVATVVATEMVVPEVTPLVAMAVEVMVAMAA